MCEIGTCTQRLATYHKFETLFWPFSIRCYLLCSSQPIISKLFYGLIFHLLFSDSIRTSKIFSTLAFNLVINICGAMVELPYINIKSMFSFMRFTFRIYFSDSTTFLTHEYVCKMQLPFVIPMWKFERIL